MPPSEPWISYTCTEGTYDNGECGEINVTQDEYPGEKAFFTCDRCEKQTWQRKTNAPPERPLPENAYLTVSFAQVRFARRIHVAMSPEARVHLKRIAPRDVVLTLEELLAIKEGLLEVSTQDRPLRLVEAINYFANEQKVPELAFYGSAS